MDQGSLHHSAPLASPQIPPRAAESTFLGSLRERQPRWGTERCGDGGAQWFPEMGLEYKPCAFTVLFLGLICSSASSGVREPSTTFASALPWAQHKRRDSEARTWQLCSSALGLQTETPPDPRRAKSVCFGHFDKNFCICSKTFWMAQIFLYLLYIIFTPLFLFQFIFTFVVLRFLYWDHPVRECT